ncbi:heparinase II/III family protein [Parvularcula sp. LCG005]|uniref:heparinase II/III domain-containing protein n=1 Tax=Parvularcula sp. LCG005 TaxID=3078805 RepID=UPI0029432077|nr:heparinase II/III family protein [Parvularcula sp. LCG005]WOI53581.1 heparinase II/III family protein [Parvularcula sp. LCG005]
MPLRVLHQPEQSSRPAEPLIAACAKLAPKAAAWGNSDAGWWHFERFDWLPACAALPHGDAVRCAQQFMTAWLEQSGQYRPRAWSRRITAARLFTLLQYLPILQQGRDAPWREAILDTIARQGRHLRRMEKRRGDSDPSFLDVSVTRSLVALCMPEDRGIGVPGGHVLDTSLTRLAGGHLPLDWRVAEDALTSLNLLDALQNAYIARRLSPPAPLAEARKVARLYVGGLMDAPDRFAALPCGHDGDRQKLQRLHLLRREEADGLLAGLGLRRLQQGKLLVHADLGHDDAGDFGAGSFSLTDGDERVVINCGAPSSFAAAVTPAMAKWRSALLSVPATSTLDEMADTPARGKLQSSDEGSVLTMTRRHGGAFHQRRLWLAPSGDNVRGEDVCRNPAKDALYRFHLPAGATVTRLDDKLTVDIRLATGKLWRFATGSARVDVAESVDATRDGIVEPSHQIELYPEREGVRWAFTRQD